jgi:hypothetical protein
METKVTASPKKTSTKMRKPKPGMGQIRGSEDAKKRMSLILEVLSGLKGTAEACAVLGVNGMRYYQLEGRALQGMATALEPQPKGRDKRPLEDQLKRVEQERDSLGRELRQTQVLLRMVRREYGVTEPPAAKPGTKPVKPRRRRRGKTRVARVLARLQEPATPETEATPSPAASVPTTDKTVE